MKILHLEDNPRDAALVHDVLTADWPDLVIKVVATRDDFLRELAGGGYDLVISDYQLPGFNGLEALQLVRERAPEVPLVFFSGTLGEESAIEAVRAGAADYVLKERMQRLPLSVQRVMREKAEHQARRQIEGALAQEQYLLRMLMDSVPDHVYFKDAESRFIAVNRALARRHGVEPAALVGRTDFDLFTPEHAQQAFEDEQHILRTGTPILGKEEKETWADGKVTWVSTSKLPLRDGSGRTIGTFGVSRDITELRQQAESLRLFRALVDRSNDVFEVIDPETARFLDVSEGGCADLGYTREELLQLRLFDVDPQLEPAKWPAMMEAIRQSGSASRESLHRRKDGSVFPVEVNIRWVSLERGYLVAVVRDITERKKTEARLRLQSSALESTASAIIITDRAGSIQWVNPAFTALTGYSLDEALGRDPNELLKSGRHAPVFYERMWETILAGRVWQSDMINRRKDGTLYQEHMTITPVRDEAGQISHFVAVKEDITERKQAEDRIREQAEIIDHAPLAILITGLDHRITYCNHGAVELYGLSREELLGRTAEEILAPEAVPRIAAARAEAIARGQWTGEVTLVTRAGRQLQAEFHMLLIRDAEGRPRGRLSIAIDITQKKKLEEQFLRAQRLESLGMLAAGIAHDLNNVLAPVLMGAPLLRARATSPTELRMLDTIENSASRGAALVRQILSFAHGVTGDKGIIQVKHLLRDLTALMEGTFPKSITLQEDIPSNLWTIRGNPTQIHQVVLNLCVNARDAMPNGGTLHLRAENRRIDIAEARNHPDAQPGPYLVIEVTDTGIGIPPEVMEHIWEPFFTTKGEGRGTGLGLSTVRGIVANHGGFISLESTPGRGTTFRIFLPADDGAAEPADKGAAGQPMPRGNGELVLFVDDEASIRDLGTAILSRFGYRVVTARDGIDAMTHYAPRAAEFALVLTDIDMPGMGGFELASAITKLNPSARLVFMTGLDAHDEAGRPALPAGLRVLSKPFAVEDLLQAVREGLDAPAPPPA
jgi:PAS domain S-box-containing protein